MYRITTIYTSLFENNYKTTNTKIGELRMWQKFSEKKKEVEPTMVCFAVGLKYQDGVSLSNDFKLIQLAYC